MLWKGIWKWHEFRLVLSRIPTWIEIERGPGQPILRPPYETLYSLCYTKIYRYFIASHIVFMLNEQQYALVILDFALDQNQRVNSYVAQSLHVYNIKYITNSSLVLIWFWKQMCLHILLFRYAEMSQII